MATTTTTQPANPATASQATAAPSALNTSAPLPWTDPNTPPTPTAPPAQASATQLNPTVNATPASVDPTALSDQVNAVTDPNSAIMQRASAQANEDSNSKGLLNSSMAVGSARNAVLQAALPIAQGNVSAQEMNAQNTQQSALQNAQQANAMSTVTAQLGTGVSTTNAAAANAQIMAQLTQQNQVQLAGVNTKYQSFLNSNSAANSMYNNIVTQIGQIQNNPNLDAAHKTDAINQQINLLQSGLTNMGAISGLNLSAGLNFGTDPGTVSAGATATAPVAAPTYTRPHRPNY